MIDRGFVVVGERRKIRRWPGYAGVYTGMLTGRYRWWPGIGGMVWAGLAVKRGR